MRIIFSLELKAACGTIFIAPLDREGQSPYVRPVGKPRVIDLRVGDQFDHGGTRYHLVHIRAYRDAAGWKGELPEDGYPVRM